MYRIRTCVCAAMGLGWLCACAFAAPPASIVSFEWRTSGDVSAAVGLICDTDCATTSTCEDLPLPAYAAGGTVMTATSVAPHAQRRCGGLCGGAAIAVAGSVLDGGIVINDPITSDDLVVWSFRHDSTAQVEAAGGILCGVGSGAAQAHLSNSWDLDFDVGPGLTLMTLGYEHRVVDDDVTTQSIWTISNDTITYFSDVLMGAFGGGFHNGEVVRLLPAGRYHLQISATLDQTAQAAAPESESFAAAVSAVCGLRFQPYSCAAIERDPESVSTCSSAPAAVSVTASGSETLSYQWQIEDADAPGGWRDAVEGQNITSFGEFSVTGAQAASATFGPFSLQGSTVNFDVRSVVRNECGNDASNAATLTVFRVGGGDGNASGTTDGDDIGGFVEVLLQGGSASTIYCAYDMNVDGVVNLDDMPSFVTVLLGG